MPVPRVLIVVPTLGSRAMFLDACVASIASQSEPVDIVLVGPTSSAVIQDVAERYDARLIDDPGSLPKAINAGFAEAKTGHEFVNWLGDDDLLAADSLRNSVAALDASPGAVLAYGACRYIDGDGKELWVSRAGRWAPRILKWGPDLIPQPGMLMRLEAFDAVGGLDTTYRFAFDLDLLLKLQEVGAFVEVEEIVSSFRWHGDSLTVSDRATSLAESERARRRALGPAARRLAWTWETPVRWATQGAAWELHRRAARRGRERG